MGQPIAVRTDFAAVEVRRLARRAKDSDQVRPLMPLPPRSTELNSQDNIWQFMRQNWLCKPRLQIL